MGGDGTVYGRRTNHGLKTDRAAVGFAR